MRRKIIDKNIEVDGITGTTNSAVIDLSNGELFSIQSVIDVNTPSAKTFDSDSFEVQTLTYATKASSGHQDFVVVSNAAGLTFAVALTKPVAEVQTLTFPSKAASTGGDYVVLTDGSGLTWAISLNKGGSDAEPTGALYVAVVAGRKVHVDISGGTTAATVAALVETAFDALTGASAIVTDDTAADGTMLLTMAVKAPCANPVPKNADDSGAGSITGVETTAGVASAAPSGAIWTAVAGARKGLADISGDTTAAQVAARAETAWNLLTGFTTSVTSDDSAANGTMTLTQIVAGPVTNPVPKNAAESGAGSIAGVETTPGYVTELNLTNNTLSIPSHGLPSGLKGQVSTSVTLPTGLSAATDYFVIVVDASTIKLATSLANALAGTAIDLTGEGAGQHTFTPTALAGASVTLQKSNDYNAIQSVGTWDNVAVATSITADANIWFEISNPGYAYARLSYTVTAGSMNTDNFTIVKG